MRSPNKGFFIAYSLWAIDPRILDYFEQSIWSFWAVALNALINIYSVKFWISMPLSCGCFDRTQNEGTQNVRANNEYGLLLVMYSGQIWIILFTQ